MSHPFKYDEDGIIRNIESMKKEYDILEGKYNTLLNIPVATPLIEKTGRPEIRKGTITETEIGNLRAEIENYRTVNVAAYEANKLIVSANEGAFNLLYDIMVKAKVPTTYWGTRPGKRKAEWLTSAWVNELKKAFPSSHSFTAEYINRLVASLLTDLKHEEERIIKEETQAIRDAEYEELCSTRIKYLGSLISKYNLPIESKKNDVILEMCKQNPYLYLVSAFEGYTDEYIDTVSISRALEEFDSHMCGSNYHLMSYTIRCAIEKYNETDDFMYISNCEWGYETLLKTASSFNEDIVKDYLALTRMG